MHNLFKRSDVNLFFEFPISIADAALGTTIEIPTIDGKKAKIKIPNGVQSGKILRLKSKGIPNIESNIKGDLLIHINIWTPEKLTKEQESFFKANKCKSTGLVPIAHPPGSETLALLYLVNKGPSTSTPALIVLTNL